MGGAPACSRLDVPVGLIAGGATNLGDFYGQKLVVFFCPAEDEAAADEIRAYEELASEFEHTGAWVVGILDEPRCDIHKRAKAHISLGVDPDGAAFRNLADMVPADARPARSRGATFIVGRDGGVDHVWPLRGHATKALEAVRERP
jgi:peroxiredoxin